MFPEKEKYLLAYNERINDTLDNYYYIRPYLIIITIVHTIEEQYGHFQFFCKRQKLALTYQALYSWEYCGAANIW